MSKQTIWIWWATGVFIGIVIGVGGLTLVRGIQPAPIMIQPPPTPDPTATVGPIRVYVNGMVAVPAVYELPPDSLVAAAVEAAGGFTPDAHTAVVNLAQPLQDGMQVYVPGQDEVAEDDLIQIVTAPTNVGFGSNEQDAAGSVGSIININTATLEELDTLPGIGPSTAQKIIEYRDSNGPFSTVESIMDVSGIGDAKFENIKDFITVEGE